MTVRQCCECKLTLHNGVWGNHEPHMYDLKVGNVTHGYCPKCFDEAMEEVDRFNNENDTRN